MKHGDYSQLAEYYRYRPNYCPSVLNALLGLINLPHTKIDVVDVGAGTGIWTEQVYEKGVRSTIAVEPNEYMKAEGVEYTRGRETSIRWIDGYAEITGLNNSCCHMITMASSFHWTDTEKALKEFHRILRPYGRFVALWNPRVIRGNELLIDIECKLKSLNPNIKRVSSGQSGITDRLTDILENSGYFEDVVYIEGTHTIPMTPDRYMKIWRSVNDVQVQLGDKFEDFMDYIREKTSGIDIIEAKYRTRAWSTRKKE